MIRIRPPWETNDEIWQVFDVLIKKIELRASLKDNRDAIYAESTELGEFLFDGENVQEENLKKLLKTKTDIETLEKENLLFLPNKNNCTWKTVKAVFNYDGLSKQDDFGKLIQMMGIEICPYCNRSYTSTVKREDGRFRRHNQVDHYKSQSRFPYLALTLPNMIPVCADCNHKKGDCSDEMLYPYREGFDNNYYFVTHPVSGYGYLIGEMDSEEDFRVSIEVVPNVGISEEYKKRVENANERLDLERLYNTHNSYIRSIFEKRHIFGECYLERLLGEFPDLFESMDDIKKLLYMRSIRQEDYHLSMLSKLTHDIDEEINRLTMNLLEYS